MKNRYIQIISFLIALLSFATFPACELDDKVEFLTDRFTEQKPGVNITDSTGYENGYAYVDLGLSVKWATFNVGASKPEEYGDYFAWGETEQKETYYWSTYKWCNGSGTSLTKYNIYNGYGVVDYKTQLDLSDDAAHVNWGGNWRMPTDAEWTELREQCIWGWTTGKGIIGYTVISKSNGNRIFLPAAGYYVNNSVVQVGFSSNYWSSSLDTDSPYYAWFMYFHSDTVSRFNNSRTFGFSVRPVLDEVDNPSSNLRAMSFSVSESKQVYFAKGNLQYHPANDEWRFAENQTDYIGNANSNCSSTYNGWLDLFGWSTGATNFGVSTSEYDDDYSGSFVDWGMNKIGNDAPNTWRTLTYDEWYYLRYTRTNADDLVGIAQVNGVNGLILLPDNWVAPYGIAFKSGFHINNGVDYYAAYQTFTAEQWSKLESAGAVFLPAAGSRGGSYVLLVQDYGYYWSATEYNSRRAYCLGFDSDGELIFNHGRFNGISVRLVKDL